jgi:hypothetical protein
MAESYTGRFNAMAESYTGRFNAMAEILGKVSKI